MKPRLIILSDLWGVQKSEWLQEYDKILSSDFDVNIYDSCALGEVDLSIATEIGIHEQFINYGITTAIKNLLTTETQKVNVLAFSIGGVIAWKAALKGLQVDNFYAISSTRLRYETQKPYCQIKLYYGGNDIHKPNKEWFEKMNVKNEVHLDYDHQMYAMSDCVYKVSNEIINDLATCKNKRI